MPILEKISTFVHHSRLTGCRHLGLLALVASAFFFTSTGQAAEKIQPRVTDGLAARVTDKGLVELENEFLEIVFDPADAGGARSILSKPSGKELAVCESYDNKHYKAFKEALPGMSIGEGKSQTDGKPYALTELRVEGTEAVAVFTGKPYIPAPKNKAWAKKEISLEETLIPEGVEDPDACYSRVRIVKTYRLRQGESRLQVHLSAVNETDRSLPLALFVLSGLRVEGEDVDVYAPSPQGVKTDFDPWTKKGSSYIIIPKAGGAWSGMVARKAGHQAVYLASDHPELFDTIGTWEAKFSGSTLAFGTPLVDIAPGQSLDLPYTLVVAQGLERLDTASPALACGMVFDTKEIKPGVPFPITVTVAAPLAIEATVKLSVHRAGETAVQSAGDKTVTIPAGQSATMTLAATVGAKGVFVIAATVTTAAGHAVTAERTVEMGITTDVYERSMPPLTGRRFFSQRLYERPVPAYLTKLDRQVDFPMTPWQVPASTRSRVLLVSEPGWTTGSLRELARRGDFEWDYQLLYDNGGEYRDIEQAELEAKLDKLEPQCVVFAGVRFEALRKDVANRLLARVHAGLGLVLTGCTVEKYAEWPPHFLRDTAFTIEDLDLTGTLADVLKSPVAKDDHSRAQAYRYGQGRLVCFEGLTLPSYGTRELFMPSLMGATEVPEEEYYHARYIKAVHWAAGVVPAARILAVTLSANQLTITCESDLALEATAVGMLAATDLSQQDFRTQAVTLQPGKQTITIELEGLPSADYVANVWLLAGPPAPNLRPTGPLSIRRAPFPQPVIDFSATYATINTGVRITAIDVDGDATQPIPQAVHVHVETAEQADLTALSVEAELANSGRDRVVWRKTASISTNGEAAFAGFAFETVSPESWFSTRVVRAGKTVARASRKIGKPERYQPIRPNDVNYQTAAGVDRNIYAARLMEPWARTEARINFSAAQIGFDGFFPWKGKGDKTTEPPMVEQDLFREKVRTALAKSGANLLFADEFKLADEYDRSPATLAAFAAHLEKVYGTIAKLNAAWGVNYQTFAAAKPALLVEAHNGNFQAARWLDFRLFMDSLVNGRYRIAFEEAGKFTPPKRIGESGPYEPSYKIGVNFYELARYSRYTASYAGLRAYWIRAFAPSDAIIQVWLGYGGQKPQHPWTTLFEGFTGIGWWGFIPRSELASMAMVAVDATPARHFPEIAKQQTEISKGLGKLLLNVGLSEPLVYLPYSQASAYFADFAGLNYAPASAKIVGQLNALGIPFSFIADEQAAIGFIEPLAGKLFVFPGIDALPEAAAQSYAQSPGQGCSLLADATAALYDGHGNRYRTSPLDAALGLDREKAENMDKKESEPVQWTADAPAALRTITLKLRPALKNVIPAGTKIWASFADGTPAVTCRRDRGVALWVNTRSEWDGLTDPLMQEALRQARVGSPVQVTPETLQPSLTGCFGRSQAHYYGFCLGKQTGKATIHLPQQRHTYDVRAGKYLGEIDAFEAELVPENLAYVYAQLPYAVTGLSAQFDKAHPQGGQTVLVSGVITASGPVTEAHVVHLEVELPDGTRPRYYESNLLTEKAGHFNGRIPLALNAPVGTWRVLCRDVATGQTTEIKLQVQPAPAEKAF